jgi:hypothetical protein
MNKIKSDLNLKFFVENNCTIVLYFSTSRNCIRYILHAWFDHILSYFETSFLVRLQVHWQWKWLYTRNKDLPYA